MLTADIMHHFGIEKDWEAVGFFETAEHKQLTTNVRNAILTGRLVAITGPTGVGKTLTLNRLQAAIAAENKVIVARSLSIEKARLVLPSLMTALFLDVSDDLATKVPTQPEPLFDSCGTKSYVKQSDRIFLFSPHNVFQTQWIFYAYHIEIFLLQRIRRCYFGNDLCAILPLGKTHLVEDEL
jgi:MoxR-like ATPase